MSETWAIGDCGALKWRNDLFGWWWGGDSVKISFFMDARKFSGELPSRNLTQQSWSCTRAILQHMELILHVCRLQIFFFRVTLLVWIMVIQIYMTVKKYRKRFAIYIYTILYILYIHIHILYYTLYAIFLPTFNIIIRNNTE